MYTTSISLFAPLRDRVRGEFNDCFDLDYQLAVVHTVMNTQLCRNGADAPFLHEVVT